MRSTLFAVATALAFAGAAQAQTAPVALQAPAPTAPTPVTTALPTPSAALGLDELAGLNGRQGSTSTILSTQDLSAVNRGNTINATTVGSGQITIDRGAFDGFAGVGNFVINSGHNNNLQGALTINIGSGQ